MIKLGSPNTLRAALSALKQQTADSAGEAPSWNRILTIREHEGALDPTRCIVIGDRGTGKSFWTGSLVDPQKRDKLSNIYSRIHLKDTDVALGFGGDEFSALHPTSGELISLLKQGFSAETIWRAVIFWLLPAVIRPQEMGTTWTDRVQWVADDPAMRREFLQTADRYFVERSKRYLFVFDALDTLASSWDDITVLMRGLLQVGLLLRPARALNIKIFLRPDMADDPALWAVGDSSKLRHDEVTLIWSRRDLHALLIQYLANDERTKTEIENYINKSLKMDLIYREGRYEIPEQLLKSETEQQKFFSALAGDYMGKSATKGRTYTWVPNHLANARGYAAPRSFLLAISVASDASKSVDTALDVQGIQEGVRQASQSRMRELREDYRWIDAVFRPIRDASVPMERRELISHWRDSRVISAIQSEMASDNTGRYLPPPRVTGQTDDPNTHAALIETLDHLGIVETTGDGRINMPDLFRLAAGVKRKGGVKLRP